MFAIAFALPASAQDSARAELDSLHERLRRAEEAIDVLRTQLAVQEASGVQSSSRARVEIFGRVLMNAFSNTARVNNADVPLFALSDSGRSGAGATVRQTSLGVAVAVPEVLGGAFAGDIQLDLFGGQQPSTGGRHFPLVRVRTARGIVRWKRAEVLFGQEVPLMAGLNAVSVASFGTPEFTASGNLWLWLPQLRATGELGTPLRIAIQGAVLAPTSADPVGLFDTDVDRAERTKRPYLQARVRAKWGSQEDEESSGEIGLGVHRGWLERDDRSLLVSEGVAVDARVPIGSVVELRGEAYSGQALRGLGGGGIGQNITTAGAPVRDRGGWFQINVRPESRLEVGAGCGVADPRDRDLPAQRQRNVTCETHIIVRPDGPLLVGFTYRRLETSFPTRKVSNDHLNLAVGFEF
ncbi:MAG: hypothetical protein H7Z74_15080 [Anaerolineae bacterium]|nr:hypothetical protein [Gemmatimonadaceae bacterium]